MIDGRGRVTLDKKTVEIGPGDAVPVRLREPHGFYSQTPQNLEIMIVGATLERKRSSTSPSWGDKSKSAIGTGGETPPPAGSRPVDHDCGSGAAVRRAGAVRIVVVGRLVYVARLGDVGNRKHCAGGAVANVPAVATARSGGRGGAGPCTSGAPGPAPRSSRKHGFAAIVDGSGYPRHPPLPVAPGAGAVQVAHMHGKWRSCLVRRIRACVVRSVGFAEYCARRHGQNMSADDRGRPPKIDCLRSAGAQRHVGWTAGDGRCGAVGQRDGERLRCAELRSGDEAGLVLKLQLLVTRCCA